MLIVALPLRKVSSLQIKTRRGLICWSCFAVAPHVSLMKHSKAKLSLLVFLPVVAQKALLCLFSCFINSIE